MHFFNFRTYMMASALSYLQRLHINLIKLKTRHRGMQISTRAEQWNQRLGKECNWKELNKACKVRHGNYHFQIFFASRGLKLGQCNIKYTIFEVSHSKVHTPSLKWIECRGRRNGRPIVWNVGQVTVTWNSSDGWAVSGGKFSHFDMIVNSLMISMRAVECGLSV